MATRPISCFGRTLVGPPYPGLFVESSCTAFPGDPDHRQDAGLERFRKIRPGIHNRGQVGGHELALVGSFGESGGLNRRKLLVRFGLRRAGGGLIIHHQSLPEAALTIARMPARIAWGNSGQASTTASLSCSVRWFRLASYPFDPPFGREFIRV